MLNLADLIRSKLLKLSFKMPGFRYLFHNRSSRILLLFITASCFYFLASAFFPMWVLLIGPILWGVPHVISSIRYTSFSFEKTQRQQLFIFQLSIWLVVFAYRISVDLFQVALPLSEYPLLFESICLSISFLYHVQLKPQVNAKLVFSTLLFSILLASTYTYPIETALFILIAHNYIPLIPWYQSCQTKQDKNTFFLATAIYFVFSILILFGVFESLYTHFKPFTEISGLNWSYEQIIEPFLSSKSNMQLWYRIVVLYSFSQALHYFIWLKAIPENHQKQQYPPSFKLSLNRLSTDFGTSSTIFLFALTLVGLLIWVLFEFHIARLIYFAIASYHGFMEISTMPFLKSNLKDH